MSQFKSSWTPTHDFVYFRRVRCRAKSQTGIIVPDADNLSYAKCIAVGPGRITPMGSLRLAPVEPGDYFLINGLTKDVVSEFMDDDGKLTFVMEGTMIIAHRKDVPGHMEVISDDTVAGGGGGAGPSILKVKATGLIDPATGKPVRVN